VTFIIAEDEALKEVLKGVTVSDNKNATRPVGVWFGQPDPEAREQSFPFITINLVDITEAKERMMASGGVSPWYYETTAMALADDWTMPYPIPVNLDYQVTTFARQPRHDRQMLSQILGNRLPLRFGSLRCIEKTVGQVAHATIRRLDMLRVGKRDSIEDGKRMFMNTFTIRVSSEIATPDAYTLFNQVSSVSLTEKMYKDYPDSLSSPSLTEIVTFSV